MGEKGVARAVGAVRVGPGCPPGHAHLAAGWGPGLLLLIALTVYTVKNAWKDDVFYSWSYFLGWLALPFCIIAGNLDSGRGWRGDFPEGPAPLLAESSQLPSQGLPNTLHSGPLESQTPVPGVLLVICARTHPAPPALRSLFCQASAFCWRT